LARDTTQPSKTATKISVDMAIEIGPTTTLKIVMDVPLGCSSSVKGSHQKRTMAAITGSVTNLGKKEVEGSGTKVISRAITAH